MRVYVVLDDGTKIQTEKDCIRKGETWYQPITVPAGRAVVKVAVILDVQREKFETSGTYTLILRGLDD